MPIDVDGHLSNADIRELQEAVRALQVDGVGGGSGNIRLIEFPFAFDTPGLADGVEVFTPSEGDVLLDAWVAMGTSAFDGTTPLAAIGTFAGGSGDSINSNYESAGFDLLLYKSTVGGVEVQSQQKSLSTEAIEYAVANGTGNAFPWFGPFVTTDPVLLVVSQDGTQGGTPIDSLGGDASLFLLVASPGESTAGATSSVFVEDTSKGITNLLVCDADETTLTADCTWRIVGTPLDDGKWKVDFYLFALVGSDQDVNPGDYSINLDNIASEWNDALNAGITDVIVSPPQSAIVNAYLGGVQFLGLAWSYGWFGFTGGAIVDNTGSIISGVPGSDALEMTGTCILEAD